MGADVIDAAELASRVDGIIVGLIRASTTLVPDDLVPVLSEHVTEAGFIAAAILLADHDQLLLTPLPGAPADLAPQPVESSVAGRAFQTERPLSVADEAGGGTIWLPVLDGAERLGVLMLRTPVVADEVVSRCADIAGLLGELIVSKSQYGDTLIRARRMKDMTLAAELRWGTLPPLTFTGTHVGIACVLEPAYEVAGDAFDYAVNDEVLHLAIFDAMGHGLEASRMANLTLAAYRWARRRRCDLTETFEAIDQALAQEFGDDKFVTGLLGTLHSRGGTLRWISAGHPAPLLLRGSRVASELHLMPSLPLGLGAADITVGEASLEPGDRLLFFTDGLVEAKSPG
ncbi:MAG TPA: PP2C family protein-serine/threonine phosphatase, partial [Acidimicrobiales bacterium]